jgi:hypothetical protein
MLGLLNCNNTALCANTAAVLGKFLLHFCWNPWSCTECHI